MTQHRPEPKLRLWQQQALAKYEETYPQDFITTATPGAGKTTFALTLAKRLWDKKLVDRIIVVAPTDHLRTQWAHAALSFGLILDPRLTNAAGPVRADTDGYVTTYSQVASHPLLHRRRTEMKRTFVILDEIHHAGDALTWGEATREAFTPASRRLSLTGTPFRTNPEERIPFVTYEETSEGDLESIADYTYGYADALKDGVVRPVVFAAYAGRSRWRNSAGEILTASLSEPGTKKNEEAAWRTALNPNGRWIPHVMVAANQRLDDLRATTTPDAGGLVLATDQDTARAYAKILELVTGQKPTLVLSDDPRSSKKIEAFNQSTEKWLVAVRMVSEGVDIPRISVLVWTTSYRTPLFFAQAIGRAVRSRHRSETATVFLPAVRPLLALAAEMETERNHVIRIKNDSHDGLDALEFEPIDTDGIGLMEYQAIDAEAEFAHILHSGKAFTPGMNLTDDDEEYLGIPGLLTPEQIADLLSTRDAEMRRNQVKMPELDTAAPITATWQETEDMRREIARLVRQVAARRRKSHSDIHIDIRKAVPGPASAEASIDILTQRRDWLLSRLH